jgi:anti-sigma factor RsiW
MMVADPARRPTDADLVAFLDGELTAGERVAIESWLARDEALQVRRSLLAKGGRRFDAAFEPLLAAAPTDRLAEMLEGLVGGRSITAGRGMRVVSRPVLPPLWRRLGLAAAGLALFLAGAAAQFALPTLREAIGLGATAENEEEEWRQAAAQYVSLYGPETLVGIPDDPAPRERELAMLGAKLDIALPIASVSLPGESLKRVQLLQYDGKPLGQIAYLDAKDGPLALCFYTARQPDRELVPEQRAGLNVVHWASRGHVFMLMGRMPAPRLAELALLLSRQLTI